MTAGIEAILISGLTLLVIMEFATFIIYGWFVPNKFRELYMNFNEEKLKLNLYSRAILSTTPFITHLPFSIFAKYYINGIGTVPRWSRLHKRIEQYYEIAIQNELGVK